MSVSFTFAELHQRTPGLTGPERMEVFYALPPSLQWLAWRHLADSCEHNSRREMEELRDG